METIETPKGINFPAYAAELVEILTGLDADGLCELVDNVAENERIYNPLAMALGFHRVKKCVETKSDPLDRMLRDCFGVAIYPIFAQIMYFLEDRVTMAEGQTHAEANRVRELWAEQRIDCDLLYALAAMKGK